MGTEKYQITFGIVSAPYYGIPEPATIIRGTFSSYSSFRKYIDSLRTIV